MTPERWRQVKQVLEAAWERDASERGTFLDQACADDAELRADVEALLASDENASEFLAAPAAELAQHSASEAAGEYWAGRRLGPYQVQREIGHGGMGTVYLAERADGQYRKQVAIKVVSPHLGTEEVLRRFRNERQVEASLDHPNIARLLDGGTTEDGLPYLVMEYVEGIRIDKWCDSRKLPVRDRLKLFRQVCAAVQSAHERDIIHRDLKPGNILVTAEGTPKLLDFGIAKVLNRDLSDGEETTIGTGPMTPEYASPEQVRGERVGPASDIYALGVVLYQLTGQLPYSAQSGNLRSVAQVICEQEPIKPSVVIQREATSEARSETPTGLRRRLAGDLDNIVLKTLRKEPERRYSSVAQFSEDLGRFLQDLPVQARKESFPYRGRKFLKRNRVPVITAVFSVVIVLAMVAGLGRFGGPAGESVVRTMAVLPLENLSHDPELEPFVDGMTDALIGDLSKIGLLRVISRDSVMRYKGVHKPAAQTARELKADVLVEGSVVLAGDRVRVSYRLIAGAMDQVLWTQSYERDLQDVPAMESDAARAIAREIQVRVTPQEQARLSSTRVVNRQAYDAYLKGRYFLYKHNVEGFKAGLKYFREAVEADPAYGMAWVGLADAYCSLADMYLPPREAMPKAKAAAQRALAIDENLAEGHAVLALIQAQYDWDWAAAERSYKRAIELSPSYAWTHLNYSIYLAELGRMEQAIREAAEANRLDPLLPLMETNLAWILYLARRPDEAIIRCRKVLELEPDTPVTHLTLGWTYVQKRMFEEAIAEFREARRLTSKTNLRAEGIEQLGYVYGITGKTEKARRLLNELQEISHKTYVDPLAIATIYAGLGEKDKVFEWLEKAYQDRDETLLLIKADPILDNLRSDSRYQSLLRRIGLPP